MRLLTKNLASGLTSRNLWIVPGLLLLAGCANTPVNFASMSEEELYAYNLEQPLLKRVLCREEQTTSSYIRKRRCSTVGELVTQNTDSVLSLDVLNYGAHYNAGLRGRD